MGHGPGATAGAANPTDNAAPDGVVFVQEPRGRAVSNTPAASPAVGPAKDVRTGELFDISGDGFAPTAKLEITLHSNPVSLGTTKADAQGKFSSKVTIPSDTPTGAHTIVVSGPAPDTSQHIVSIPIVVSAAVESNPAPGFSLPAIRHQVGLLWTLAMLPIGLGLGLVLRSFSRNRLRRSDLAEAADPEIEMLEPGTTQHFRPALPESPLPPTTVDSPHRRPVELTGELLHLPDEALVPGNRD